MTTIRAARVLVCGGREFKDYNHVSIVLNEVLLWCKRIVVGEGGANGADSLARLWCQNMGIPCITMYAAWDFYKNSAGPIRNKWMLEFFEPNLVLAFQGGRGTAHMKRIAREAQIKVYNV